LKGSQFQAHPFSFHSRLLSRTIYAVYFNKQPMFNLPRFKIGSEFSGRSEILPIVQSRHFMASATSQTKNLLDPSRTIILLLDHQSGLFQTVKDISVVELRTNTIALAKLATILSIPVITTASVPDGPNGPLMPEIHEFAPHAIHIPRKGEISAWDNEDFVKAVKKSGKQTLIIAGVWTSVCVAFPAIQAKAEGYDVYAVIDASGDPSVMASQTTVARLAQAGVTPISTNAMVCEFQRTWARPEAAEFASLFALFNPNYNAAIESFKKAEEVGQKSRKNPEGRNMSI
jgi:nicotinamidase-related amidase